MYTKKKKTDIINHYNKFIFIHLYQKNFITWQNDRWSPRDTNNIIPILHQIFNKAYQSKELKYPQTSPLQDIIGYNISLVFRWFFPWTRKWMRNIMYTLQAIEFRQKYKHV